MTSITGIATSFIDFTRASNATVTDSDGKVKWAPHNLLTNSESFDAASWTKSSVTPTANSIAAPNGTTTADTLAASGANGTTLQTFTAEAISYTFGVWLKRKTGTGNIQIAADSGTYTTVTITSDWALYTVTQTPTAGSKTAGIRIVTSADEVYAWGASLYRSDLAMQPNTSAYPLYNPTTPKNLLGFTEDFSSWATYNATPTANTTAAPNGLTTADTLTGTIDTSQHLAYRQYTAFVNATAYKLSVFAKAGTNNFLYIGAQSFGGAIFDLANGVVGSNISGGIGSIQSIGNGWYRCIVSVTATGTSSQIDVGVAPSGTNSVGPATGTIYIWGAQLSNSASLDSYVPVYGAAVTSAAYYGPRRDFDPVTLACKGLLVEELRTNLLLNSATLSTQNVTVTAAAHTLTFYGTGTITLSGTSTAGPLVGTGVNNRVSLTFTPTAGTLTLTVTGSVTQAQLEANASFATSYIPVGATSAGATRLADVASVSTQAFPYSASNSTIVASVSALGVKTGGVLRLGPSAGVTGLLLYQNNSSWRAYVDASVVSIGTATPSTVQKMALAYNGATNGAVLDGGTVSSVGTTVAAVAEKLEIGGLSSSSDYFCGHIRQITYLPRRISNTELQTRTS